MYLNMLELMDVDRHKSLHCSFYTCISMLVLVQDYIFIYVVFGKESVDHMTT